MRVLFSCTGTEGHFAPLLPLARAFDEQEHEVVFATAGAFAPRVRSAGFDALAAGLDAAEISRLHAPYGARLLEIPPAERRPYAFTWRFATVDAPAKLAELQAVAAAWRPDLIVHDAAELPAPPVAVSLGVPSVNHGFGQVIPRACLERASGQAALLWHELGLEPQPWNGMYRGGYVDVWPPSLQGEALPAETVAYPMGPAAALPSTGSGWQPPDSGRPTVYATLGTVLDEMPLMRLLLDALADVDCSVLMTVGRHNDPTVLSPWPENAVVERFVPQTDVLPHCSLVVAHGGSGSTLGALAHGVPLLILPHAADQFDNASSCRAAGVALVLMPGEVTVDSIREAVAVLLDDHGYRDRAGVLAQEIAALPSPGEVAARLVASA